ncbi:MAG: alpha/beta hydrolase family protein [Anaerolineae bacterium]
MAVNRTDDQPNTIGATEIVDFAGDNVRLAGQIDYPEANRPAQGYPLIFIIQHGTSISRADYKHITTLGMSIGAAVFRWDKRGTGKSGSGATGTLENDTLKAYEFALSLPSVNISQVVIFAQSEGTLLLGQEYKAFARLTKPCGIVLAGNMLDERAILALTVPVHIVVSKNDWNDWRTYAERASDAHARQYGYDGSFYVATNTNRLLMYTSGNTFHKGSETSIKHWLKQTCQIS